MIGIKRNRNREISFSISRPLNRVELHVHLDGSIRSETIYELSKEKKLPLPGKGTFEDLNNYLICKNPVNLATFLMPFDVITKSIAGDLKAIERVAYEFVEDEFNQGVAYFEARFCPHLIIPEATNKRHFSIAGEDDDDDEKDKSQEEIVDDNMKWVYRVTEALIKGLTRGERDFGTKGNLIATVIRGYDKRWFEDTLELAANKDFHKGKVIGIDIAAVPATADETEFMLEKEATDLFEKATKLGIRRTVHAGEAGPGAQVNYALDNLHAERIGHGYRIMHDKEAYERVRKEKVHLECCPWSSLLTNAISMDHIPHPIVHFFQDNFNISINTDDPTLTGTRLDDEFRLLSHWNLTEAHFTRASFNGARSCFLPENEKADLIQDLGKAYGFVSS